MKTIVIMQPTFFPWTGLFEQIRLADVFVHYDDAQFSKGSLTNRVKIKTARGPKWLTVPLRDLHMGQTINDVHIDEAHDWRRSHIDLLKQAYAEAPFLNDALQITEGIYQAKAMDIASLDMLTIEKCCEYLNLNTHFVRSSSLGMTSRSSNRVLDIVRYFAGDVYVTGHGASRYLDHEAFEAAGICVQYMDYQRKSYPQLHGQFDPHMSILDLIANTGPDAAKTICSTTVPWMDFVHG